MLHQITDLFMASAGHYSAEQLGVYDDVLQMLVAKVDVAARTTLAKRLAPVAYAPSDTIRMLAIDESIEVAEPVLTQAQLTDAILNECIALRGQDHMLAIATRQTLSASVSGQLIMKGDRKVLGAVANNPGAAISDPSFKLLVDRGAADDWLAESIAKRTDIPEHHFRELISRASEIVRERLIATSPAHRDLIETILDRPPSPKAGEKKPPKDYRTAELVVMSREPVTEAVVCDFARAKQLDETVVAIGKLAGIPPQEIERLFMNGPWSSPVAIILKAIGFHLSAVQTVYAARLADGELPKGDLNQIKAEFIALQRSTAERIMRFYRVRKTADPSLN